jgi:hypothetical protein
MLFGVRRVPNAETCFNEAMRKIGFCVLMVAVCGLSACTVGPAASPYTPEASSSTGSNCPADIVLPAGVDEAACGGTPPTATAWESDDGATKLFTSADGNVFCDINDTRAYCDVKEYTFAPQQTDDGEAPAAWLEQTASAYGSGDPGEEVTETPLAAGGSFYLGDLACLGVGEDAVQCWNTSTHHGFLLSKSTQTIW